MKIVKHNPIQGKDDYLEVELRAMCMARDFPNEPIRISGGFYLYNLKRENLSVLLEIYDNHDEDTGSHIGWIVKKYHGSWVDYSDPSPRLKDILEMLERTDKDFSF